MRALYSWAYVTPSCKEQKDAKYTVDLRKKVYFFEGWVGNYRGDLRCCRAGATPQIFRLINVQHDQRSCVIFLKRVMMFKRLRRC